MQNYDASTIVNKADVKYVQNGETVVVESDPVEVIKPVEGNVTIVKSADKKVAYPGDVVTYTVTVHNGKTVDAKNVVVTDANNFAGTITNVEGTGYRFENGKFIVDELKAGASITLHYTYTVEPDDVPTEILKNIATVHVPGTGPDYPDQDVPSNEVDVEVPGDDTETNIPEKGELVVTKTVDKTKAQVGDVLNYTVKVTNTGNAALNNILCLIISMAMERWCISQRQVFCRMAMALTPLQSCQQVPLWNSTSATQWLRKIFRWY